MQIVVAEKQIPAINPTFKPVVQPDDPILVMRMPRPMLATIINSNEAIMICATPFLALGSSTLTPDALIHAFLNKKEYHTAPSTKYAMPPANTASQLMLEKSSVFITVGFSA